MRPVVIALLAVLSATIAVPAAAAMPDEPSPVTLTADEEATLAEGEVVVRLVDAPEGATMVSVIDVDAPPATVLDAVLDVEARVAEIGSLKEIAVYERESPDRMGVRYTLGVMGRRVVFHTEYQIVRSDHWTAYALDQSRENDIEASHGSYRAFSRGEGSRLVYRSFTEAGMSVPNWLKRWLVGGSLKEQLQGIRARAEGP